MPTKGQSVSKEIIAKKNKTFLKNNLKKYKWKLV